MKQYTYAVMKIIILLILCHTAILAKEPIESFTNILSHKNNQLDVYLEGIRFNSSEKTELSEYIKPTGTYLEIGSGGDPIKYLLDQIPKGYSPTIIVSDIDQDILDILPERHPSLRSYLNLDDKIKKPKLKFMHLDATDMSVFDNGSLSGINASAIAHEIWSYAGSQQAFTKFLNEVFRVLEPDGVLIYRDPEGVLDPYKTVKMDLKTKSMRLFVHLFLCKFLDEKCTDLYDKEGNMKKVFAYDKEKLRFCFYKKNSNKKSYIGYSEYLKMPTYEIDFNRKLSIHVPRQLCREIERHYLTFLKDCNPLMFVKLLPDLNSDKHHVIFLSNNVEKVFLEYVKKYHISFIDSKISSFDMKKLQSEIERRMMHIENGIRIKIASNEKLHELKDKLINKGFDPEKYVQEIGNHWILLDYRVFGLLYNEFIKWFDKDNTPFGSVSELAAKWLKLEGEENYFYFSVDELITFAGSVNLPRSIKDNDEEILILCPINPNKNKFISRNHYEYILEDSVKITDILGYEVVIKEGKRIIHFAKMSIKEAIPIYNEIISKGNYQDYPMLSELIETLYNFL